LKSMGKFERLKTSYLYHISELRLGRPLSCEGSPEVCRLRPTKKAESNQTIGEVGFNSRPSCFKERIKMESVLAGVPHPC